jgi:RES domain-containing protein
VIITVWRICAAKHVKDAFSGEGAKIYPGRWNKHGTKMVYTAQSESLALLEIIVNVPSYRHLKTHVVTPATFDTALITFLDPSKLPTDWLDNPIPPSTRSIGDAWAKSSSSAVFCVPSTVIPTEYNYLLNPDHSDFSRILIGKPKGLHLDPRLAKKLKAKKL